MFANFTDVNLTSNNPIINFAPVHCRKKPDGTPLTIIAYSGNQTYTNPIVRDL